MKKLQDIEKVEIFLGTHFARYERDADFHSKATFAVCSYLRQQICLNRKAKFCLQKGSGIVTYHLCTFLSSHYLNAQQSVLFLKYKKDGAVQGTTHNLILNAFLS